MPLLLSVVLRLLRPGPSRRPDRSGAPFLFMDADGAFEGILQRAWDRALETKPVLLVLIGSDLSVTEAMNNYGRPFHQRGREMALGP